MTSNNSWQNQGRQQHGWFGHGTGTPNIVPVADPPRWSPDPGRAVGVYPLEYLISLLTGASLGRVALSAALRNLGWRAPASGTEAGLPPDLTILQGRQDKHVIGTNNYIPGRSILTEDPAALVREYAGRGDQRGPTPVGQPGSVEMFDTGDRVIGIWKDTEGEMAATTRGTIRYARDGVHVVPAEPTPATPAP